MLETPDWKREKIGDYRALSAIVAQCQESILDDEKINALLEKKLQTQKDIDALCIDRHKTIAEARQEQQMIKMELLDHWDIDAKTFKCDMGSATLRTTKILEINDQKELLCLLFRLERLESAIRTLNTTYLKKLKDADMIPDVMAYYKSTTNVAITEAKE